MNTKGEHEMAVHHTKDGTTHLIGVDAMRVMVIKDGNGWFAQGLDIDYASCGSSIDEVQKNFELGLALTIKEHLVIHGNIKKLLQPAADPQVWKEFYDASVECVRAQVSTFQIHELGKIQSAEQDTKFPFSKIAFIHPEALAA